MKAFYKHCMVFASIIIGLLVVRWYLKDYISFSYIQAHRAEIEAFLNEYYFEAVLLLLALYLVLVLCALPLTILVTLIGGSLFGPLWAAIYAITGLTIGGIVGFLIYRYAARGWIMKHYGKRLATFEHKFNEHGANYLLFLQLSQLMPAGIINMLAALSEVSLKTLVWTTVIGVAPSSLVYAFLGRKLMGIQQLKDVYTPQVIGAFVLIACLALLPLGLRFIVKRRAR